MKDARDGGPGRTLMGLVWDKRDVAGVLTSLLEEDEAPDQMEIPRGRGPHFDQVLRNGTPIGVATGRTISANLRQTISLCVIEQASAAPGTEVAVLWGGPGTPQREIRATVTALPFKHDRRRTDVTSL